ncbi:L,D-transpeptidase family protein [Rhodopseudomonas sp. P2A-2r]|uniref:L,D-transpeptidase family protein n=1 Tax=unclassified Rhodopseudomonas TaxID=2638247 RepID=UPI0022345D3B|nr:L,D-transpeptidase family protein [Rhodopseudomonas sp. P2A-2r]UZE50400.1 L,D-transpeptidase family protein [Rhodopseudomonas sp. P2A-2r]
MRDYSNGRSGFDRVLMAVAATFLTVTTSAAFAQAEPARSSAADLAIDAAVPRPEPANVPPPTAGDFKSDVTASTPDAAKTTVTATEAKPAAATPESVTPAASTATAAPTAVEPAKEQAKETSTEAAKPASTVASADQPVVDKLREMLGAKTSRLFDRKGERAAVEKFYTTRNFAPLWTQAGTVTAIAKSVVARLKDAGSDGLNAADYPIPDFAAATSPDALAEAELKLTASVLDYARQAQSGRMHWSQVSGDIQYPEHPIDPTEVLVNVSTAKNPSAALDGYNPPHKAYQELKKKLAELRGETGTLQQPIGEGPALKFVKPTKKQAAAVMEDPRVPLLRARLNVDNPDDTKYDAAVADAVRKFQASNELKASGVLDEATVRAMNAPKRDRQIDTVIVNMERWRWLPRQLGAAAIGNAYVILNIPDYSLKVMHNGAQAWTTRVVVGKPGNHATPLLTETMKYITVNPTWNVPPSIIYNEYLPALQQDPTVLQRMGLKLTRNSDGSIHIAQPPGEANALGRIRFNFPNKFLVYQHDTPDKNLFARDERAFSHGCMRVQNPDQYAATLLNIIMPGERYTPEKIRGMYGKSEIDLKFPTPIPVNITYQTAFVDDAGKLQLRKDVYGRDAQMLAILRNAKGKDLESVVAHAQPSYARPKADIPQGVAFNDSFGGGNSSNSGPSFFERLFGGPTPAPVPTGNQRQRRIIR